MSQKSPDEKKEYELGRAHGYYIGMLDAWGIVMNYLNTLEVTEVSKSEVYHHVASLRPYT